MSRHQFPRSPRIIDPTAGDWDAMTRGADPDARHRRELVLAERRRRLEASAAQDDLDEYRHAVSSSQDLRGRAPSPEALARFAAARAHMDDQLAEARASVRALGLVLVVLLVLVLGGLATLGVLVLR